MSHFDYLLRQFWEVEEKPTAYDARPPDELLALDHFNTQHSHTTDGQFIVLLPRKPGAKPLGGHRPSEGSFHLNIHSIQGDTSKNSKLSWRNTFKHGMVNWSLKLI